MKTPVRIALPNNYEAAAGDHFWSSLPFLIAGLTRNPGGISGFPLSREWRLIAGGYLGNVQVYLP
jgi:hypothetical protein